MTGRLSVTIPMTCEKITGFQLPPHDLVALLAFSRVTLEAWAKKPLEYLPRKHGWPTIGNTKPGRAFQELVPVLRGFEVLKGPLAEKTVWVNLRPTYDHEEEAAKMEERKQRFVSAWRREMRHVAPGVDIRKGSAGAQEDDQD